MALSKIDPKKVIQVCSITDESIDHEAMGEDWKKYQETYKFDLLKFKEGSHPTIFLVKNVLASDEAKIKQDHFKVEFPELKDASPEELKKMDVKKMRPTIKQVGQQEMMIKYFKAGISKYKEGDQEFECTPDIFPLNILQEIGAFIMLRAQLGDDLKND